MSQPPDDPWSSDARGGWNAPGEQTYGPSSWDSGPAADGYGARPAPAEPAGFWIRFLGAFIDGIVLGIAGALLRALIGGGEGLVTLLGAVYFTYLHSSSGQTLGNRAAGLRVVDVDTGGTIDPIRAFLRWLVSLVSGALLGLGYLWMLWDPAKQTWHDKAARSNVYRTR